MTNASTEIVSDRIADPWGPRTPYGPGDAWPMRIDRHLAAGVDAAPVDRWVQWRRS